MKKGVIVLLIILSVALLSGCSEEGSTNIEVNSSDKQNKAVVDTKDNEVENNEASESQAINELDAKRKAEPRQVPSQFPLPILDGWVEGYPFEELTTGKKAGWSAEFFFEGDLEDNLKRYEKLLLEHGYEVTENIMVTTSLGPGYIVSGHISGIKYAGSVVFDTNADGQQRAWMNFVEED